MLLWLLDNFLLTVPGLFLLAGYWCGRRQVNTNRVAIQALLMTGFIVIITAVGLVFEFFKTTRIDRYLIHSGAINHMMLILVVIMAWVLVKFSRQYMAGENRLGYYYRWLLLTLGAVSLTVIANHLLLFWLGWVAISLSLHKLLTFYPNRQRALLAAHKKFILARTAELSLLLAIILLYLNHQTLLVSELILQFNLSHLSNQPLSLLDQWAAICLATTALIKCAQLPMHGWLIQVVESPTPVSALLHAGVINLGGFLLILFAPLIVQADYAKWFILLVAGISTLLSALIMTTRISYKVRLAWSTSAQMGLMLLECALGYYELALLHLLAHSGYKAYAFLNSGHAVYEDLSQRLSPQTLPPAKDWLFAGIGALALTAGMMYVIDYQGPWSLWLLFGLALSLLLIQQPRAYRSFSLTKMLLLAILLISSYTLQKLTLSYELGFPESFKAAPLNAPDLWLMAVFISLFILHLLRFYCSHWLPIQRLSLALYAGLYLDEWFTRMTFKIWPLQLPVDQHRKYFNHNHSLQD